MKLDELFEPDISHINKAIKSIEQATGWHSSLKEENNLPLSDTKNQMIFWIKAHLMQLYNDNIKEVPLKSIATELNRVANKKGFPYINKDDTDIIKQLIPSNLSYIKSITDDKIILNVSSNNDTNNDDVPDKKDKKDIDKEKVDNMASKTIDKGIKSKKGVKL